MKQVWFVTGSSRGFGRALVQAALDRATAEGTAKLTGEWPGVGADDQSGEQSDGAAGKSGHER